jgi:hypothetical protein
MSLDRRALARTYAALRREREAAAEAEAAYMQAHRSAADYADGLLCVAGDFANVDDLRGQFADWLRFRARLRCMTVGALICELIQSRDQRFRDLALATWGFDPCTAE